LVFVPPLQVCIVPDLRFITAIVEPELYARAALLDYAGERFCMRMVGAAASVCRDEKVFTGQQPE
jgi:hypothetical protein